MNKGAATIYYTYIYEHKQYCATSKYVLQSRLVQLKKSYTQHTLSYTGRYYRLALTHRKDSNHHINLKKMAEPNCIQGESCSRGVSAIRFLNSSIFYLSMYLKWILVEILCTLLLLQDILEVENEALIFLESDSKYGVFGSLWQSLESCRTAILGAFILKNYRNDQGKALQFNNRQHQMC